jgi:hypothetical protein
MTDFHYEDDDFQMAKGMTKAFNQICTEEQVQCTVTSEPQTFRTWYQFKNFNDRRVQVMYDDIYLTMSKGQEAQLLILESDRHRPYIVTLEDGVPAIE